MRTQPGTPVSKIDRATQAVATPGGNSRSKEEKIVVTVRLRPLNKKETLSKDQVAWECLDDHTIVSKPQSQERLHQQSSFTFDKVFGPESITDNVYEDGVKNVALSALMGINERGEHDRGRRRAEQSHVAYNFHRGKTSDHRALACLPGLYHPQDTVLSIVQRRASRSNIHGNRAKTVNLARTASLRSRQRNTSL